MSSRVHRLGTISPKDVPAIYSSSQFTVYPSLFEGLGLPVLEAFACGSPVLTSDRSSLPEVAGEAAVIVDAYSTDEIADGMYELASDPVLRQRLIEKGFQQVSRFTWERTAEEALTWIEARWDTAKKW